jgi:hypothetical protein
MSPFVINDIICQSLSRAPGTSATLLHTLVATLPSSCHELHSSPFTCCRSLELLSQAPLFSTQLPHSLALSLLMYDYIRVILILYKPPGEEDEFLTLCFRPLKPKYLLRVRYLPCLYSLTSQLLPAYSPFATCCSLSPGKPAPSPTPGRSTLTTKNKTA